MKFSLYKYCYLLCLFFVFQAFTSGSSFNEQTSIGKKQFTKEENTTKLSQDSLSDLKIQIKNYITSRQAEEAVYYTKQYIRETRDLSIINDHFFDEIKTTDVYLNFKNRYQPDFSFLSLFYLFAGLLGVFIAIVLNLRKGVPKKSTLLISVFVLLHSLFILHLSLYLINCHYYFPNTLLYSTVFTLLYGPLIYFYFKASATGTNLKWFDILHLLPAVILLIYIAPIYVKSAQEKFIILFDREDILLSQANVIMIAKIASMLIYAFLSIKLYLKAKQHQDELSRKLLWQRNFIAIYVLYVIAFLLYYLFTSGYFDSPLFFHFLIFVMVLIVFYVAYISYAQPEVLKGSVRLVDPISIFKYKKSGLTSSFSNELKNDLVRLFEEEKVFKQSDLNLDALSDMMDTTRHNASQVINEHFGLNFFELVNKYRIEEAVQMMEDGKHKKLNIIDIAYAVGYNNKVTFNKSFKKIHDLTPSQYIKSLKKT